MLLLWGKWYVFIFTNLYNEPVRDEMDIYYLIDIKDYTNPCSIFFRLEEPQSSVFDIGNDLDQHVRYPKTNMD